MSGKTMDVSVIVKLVDRLTAPLRGLQRGFERFGAIARRIGTIGAAIAGISFAVPIQQAAAFDQKLRDMVVTAGEFGSGAEKRIRELGAEMEQLSLKVGITSDQLTDARALLTAAGLDDSLIGRLMPTIGRVAKAASADALDTAKTASALSGTLLIGADQMELALAKLVTAGKLGRFEFKDMARELPELSAQMAKLGVTGMEAVSTLGAALQVAMMGTSSSTTAANNLKNFLTKLNSPETLKNFKDAGVDLTRVMADAAAKGINPVEAAIQKIIKLTKIPKKEIDEIFNKAKKDGKSDQQAMDEVKKRIETVLAGSKLGELFKDMQVLDFLAPMLLNVEKYKDFKKQIEASGLGEMARDFDTQFAGLSTQMMLFGEIGTQAIRRIGLAFAKNLPWMNDGLQQMLAWVARVDKEYPGLIDQVMTWAGATLAVVAALAILGPVVSAVGAGIGVLIALFGLLLSPVGLVVAALAGAAILIWRNWAQFAPSFARMWQGLKAIFWAGVQGIVSLFRGDWSGVRQAGQLLWSGLKALGSGASAALMGVGRAILDWVRKTFGVDVIAALKQAFEGAGEALQSVLSALGRGITFFAQTNLDQIRSLCTNMTSWLDGWTGGAFSEALGKVGAAWDRVAEGAKAAFEKIKSAWSEVVDWISSHLPKMPDFGGWIKRNYGGDGAAPSESAPSVDPMGNATGGGVGKQSAIPSARAVAARAEVGGRIVVSAVGGAKVERVQSDNPTVPLTADRGAVVGRA